MKTRYLLVIYSVVSLAGMAQEAKPGEPPQSKFQFGTSIGCNLTGTQDHVNYFGAEVSPQLGWNVSGVVSYKPVKQIRLIGLIGGISERYATKGAARYEFQYYSAEASTLITYVPVNRDKLDVFAGTGFSVRRISKGSMGGEITFNDGSTIPIAAEDMMDRVYRWNYFLPFVIGTSLNLSRAGSMLITMEYQLGLNQRMKPFTYNYPGVDPANLTGNEKIYSVCLKLAFMLSVGSD
jgi:hypothetical protein